MKKILLTLTIAFISLSSCSNKANDEFKEIQLRPNEILINVNWRKNSTLYILSEDTLTNTTYYRRVGTYYFRPNFIIKK